jgi:ABC-type dipeptide/oligopeptide/nickel transport system permease component
MAAYVVRRVFWTIPVLFVVLSLIFFAMLAIGGDPTRHGRLVGLSSAVWVKSGDPKPEAITDNMRRVRGLDQPWYEQYARYLKATVTFDYGATFTFPYRTVEGIIAAQAPISLELGILALLWALVFGLPLGVAGALARGSPLDLAARTFAVLGVAVPNFLVATLLIYVLSVRGGLLPTSGWGSWQAKVLPSLTLALLPMAYCARLVRASMLEVLHQDYVRAAAARGLRTRTTCAPLRRAGFAARGSSACTCSATR